MKRILLIANKIFEVEPILNALLNATMNPAVLQSPPAINLPYLCDAGKYCPRAIWTNFPGQQFELWCIQDIMPASSNYSSSSIKAAAMPNILAYATGDIGMVVALGTAASGSIQENNNGSVVMGSNVFIHNYHPPGGPNPNPESNWSDPAHTDCLLTSTVTQAFFDSVDTVAKKAIASNLLKPFLYPAETIQLMADLNYLALSTVNVTDYHDFPLSDPAGRAATTQFAPGIPVISVESTHGLIRLLTNSPFIFLSGIVNRFTMIGIDVNGTDNQGNGKTMGIDYSGAFNIGVALITLMTKISAYVG
jgi:hypothetical protein